MLRDLNSQLFRSKMHFRIDIDTTTAAGLDSADMIVALVVKMFCYDIMNMEYDYQYFCL